MKKCLVTGGAGFIGSNLVERLIRDAVQVRVLDNLSTGFLENLEPFWQDIDFIQGDPSVSVSVRRSTDEDNDRGILVEEKAPLS